MNIIENSSYIQNIFSSYDERRYYSVFDSAGDEVYTDRLGNIFYYQLPNDNDYTNLLKVYISDRPDILLDTSKERFFYREPLYDNAVDYETDIILTRIYIDRGVDILSDRDGRRFFFRRNYDENGRPIIDNEGDEVLSRIYIDLV